MTTLISLDRPVWLLAVYFSNVISERKRSGSVASVKDPELAPLASRGLKREENESAAWDGWGCGFNAFSFFRFVRGSCDGAK